MKILIIEDDRPQRIILNKLILSLKTHETIMAHDAFEGFATLRVIPDIDLVIVDHQMPYATGTAFIKKVRATPAFAKLPIIVSSAEPNNEVYLDAGASACLIKPYSLESLQEILDSLFKGKKEGVFFGG